MPPLRFVGVLRNTDRNIITVGGINSLLSGNLTQTQVNQRIATLLSSYATKQYVKTQDDKLADSAFIDAADNTRLAKANLNKAGYPFTLDSTGKIPVKLIKVSGLQKYPKLTLAGTGRGGTTTTDVGLMSLTVPDPGYAYKLFVTGTVSGAVRADNGSRAVVTVYRGDDVAVAQGYGISESYQAPTLGAVSSRMFVAAPLTPAPWPNVIMEHVPSIGNSSARYNSDWLNLTWMGVNTDPFTTTMSGVYMQAPSNMSNVTVSASISFANGIIPADSWPGNEGKLTAEMRIFSSLKGIVATAIPSNGRQVSGTLTAQATNLAVTKGELFTVQVKQLIYSPWGLIDNPLLGIQPGKFATWAPAGSGTSNTLTLIPGLGSAQSGGDISVLPLNFATQTAITGATTLNVRLQSPGGSTVVAESAPSPRIMAIPIPA